MIMDTFIARYVTSQLSDINVITIRNVFNKSDFDQFAVHSNRDKSRFVEMLEQLKDAINQLDLKVKFTDRDFEQFMFSAEYDVKKAVAKIKSYSTLKTSNPTLVGIFDREVLRNLLTGDATIEIVEADEEIVMVSDFTETTHSV